VSGEGVVFLLHHLFLFMTENASTQQISQEASLPASPVIKQPVHLNELSTNKTKASPNSQEASGKTETVPEDLAFTIHILTPKKQKLSLQVRCVLID
jgi:hypothetical protein